MSYDIEQVALDIARRFIPATDPQTLAKLQVEIIGAALALNIRCEGELAAYKAKCGELAFEDHHALVKFLDGLYDDGGQGGDPWAPAQAARQAIVWWNMMAGVSPLTSFKNFHRSLCERFGYAHDRQYWWRDLISLEEHIASLVAKPRCNWPDCGHDTNMAGYSEGCTGNSCPGRHGVAK